MSKRSKWCLIGIPDHQGVFNVGGRIGAAYGPKSSRRIIPRLSGSSSAFHETMTDLGDVGLLTRDVEKNLRHAADRIRDGHSTHPLSVIVGGGHDHGYSHLLGLSEALEAQLGRKPRIGCINIDAHLDVRKPAPAISSGSPFFLAIENQVLFPADFVEFGIQAHCNSHELWSYVKTKGIKTIGMVELRKGLVSRIFENCLNELAGSCDSLVVSLDLDAAAEAFAPGVSAPQAEGFTGSEIIEITEIAGRNEKVVSLGIFELNPFHDIGERTARLAATAAYHFIDGALQRGCES